MRARAGLRPGDAVTVRVARYDPDRDRSLRWQEWQAPWEAGLTVLELLFRVKETQDGTLTFRAACRMGVCGSCGMHINGKPRLACDTQVAELGPRIVVGPLPNHDVIKDLVPDLDPTFARHRAVQPYLIRDDRVEMDRPTREYHQTPAEMNAYLQFAGCITCSLCVAACPVSATDRLFLGPQALAQAYRYTADSRDGGFAAREAGLARTHGVVSCHLAGACSEACPKGVDPALAIQLLNRALLTGPSHRGAAPLVEVGPPGAPPEDRPVAPPPTVTPGGGESAS